MAGEETKVIDSVGKAQPPRAISGVSEALSRGTRPLGAAAEVAQAAAVQGPASSALAQAARDMAVAPPVDTARVEELKSAIASGAYRPDPMSIAAKMMALEAGSPKG
jgi:negative regulator of flagellin synthesis FlgM